MKLAISNIGWTADWDRAVYSLMRRYGFAGLEIAPTRVFPEAPYDRAEAAAEWAEDLLRKEGFCVPSMQSIWYGRREKIFASDEERRILVSYTKKAIDFAAAIGCRNLVFGCPVNRNLPVGADPLTAAAFFRELGEYAAEHGTAIGLEANPPIYNTNFINDTKEALELIEKVDSKGFLLNLDIGTMIQNQEKTDELRGKVHLINHVHVSEPGLKPIMEHDIHKEVKHILDAELYEGFISIEMSNTNDMNLLMKAFDYVKKLFG